MNEAWIAIDRLLDIWKSDPTIKIIIAVSVLLYGHNSWILMKYLDVACCFKQILEAAPNQSTVVQPLTSHFTNHPNKMNKT